MTLYWVQVNKSSKTNNALDVRQGAEQDFCRTQYGAQHRPLCGPLLTNADRCPVFVWVVSDVHCCSGQEVSPCRDKLNYLIDSEVNELCTFEVNQVCECANVQWHCSQREMRKAMLTQIESAQDKNTCNLISRTYDKAELNVLTYIIEPFNSGDQLSGQNSLKINFKFLDSLNWQWKLIFIPWQLYFSLDYSLISPYLFPWQNSQFLDCQG